MSLSSEFQRLWPALPSPLGADLLRLDAPYTSIAQAVREGAIGGSSVNHRLEMGLQPALAVWWKNQLCKPLSSMVDRGEDVHQRDVLGVELVGLGYDPAQQWIADDTPMDLLQLALAHGHRLLASALHVSDPDPALAFRHLPVRSSEVCGYGDPLNHQLPKQLPVLHAAIAAGHAELASWLLSIGLPVDARDSSGQTPLFQARTQETVELLLNAGANPGVVDQWGCSVFDRRMSTHPQVGRILAKSLLDSPSVTGISQQQRLSALFSQIETGVSLNLLRPQLKALGNDVSLTQQTPEGPWSVLGWIARAHAMSGRHAEILGWAMDRHSVDVSLPCGCTDTVLARDVAFAHFDSGELGKCLRKHNPDNYSIEDFKEGMVRVRALNKARPARLANVVDAAGRAMGAVLDVALFKPSSATKSMHAEGLSFLPDSPQAWILEDAAGRTPLGRWFEAWADYLGATADKPSSSPHSVLGKWRTSRQDIPPDVAGPILRILTAALAIPSSLPEEEDPDASIQPLTSLGAMGPWDVASSFTQELAWWVNIASARLPNRLPLVSESQWDRGIQTMKQAPGLWPRYANAWCQRRLESALPSKSFTPRSRM